MEFSATVCSLQHFSYSTISSWHGILPVWGLNNCEDETIACLGSSDTSLIATTERYSWVSTPLTYESTSMWAFVLRLNRGSILRGTSNLETHQQRPALNHFKSDILTCIKMQCFNQRSVSLKSCYLNIVWLFLQHYHRVFCRIV